MSKKDWKTVLSIAIPWGVTNGLVYIIWGPEVQIMVNMGILVSLGIWVLIRLKRQSYGRNAR